MEVGESKRRKKLDEPQVRFGVKKKLGWAKVGCCGRRRVVASDWVGREGLIWWLGTRRGRGFCAYRWTSTGG